MSTDEKRLTELPVLSHIQQVELTRRLTIPKRVLYTLVSTLSIWLMFAFSVSIALLVVIVLFDQVIDPVESMNDVVILSLPIIVTYIAVIGFSNHPAPTNIRPGDSFRRLVIQQARSGFLRGLIGGFIFSVVWNLAMQFGNLYIELNTIFSVDFRLDEILLYSVLLGLVVAPTFAMFRSYTAVASHLTLYWLARSEVQRSAA
jgi:hypothetical protein